MDNNELIIDNINLLLDKITNQISNLELNNKNYLYHYKIGDLKNLQLCKCERCGKQFVPMYRNNHQKFCNDKCRYGSTKSTRRYKVSNDVRFRKIDNLRKAIYERRYRAKVSNKKLPHNKELDLILIDLKTLLKEKDNMSLKEFNNNINELRIRYKQAFRMR